MILDQQLINGMFQDQSLHDNSEQPLQEVSLNFTYSSRSSKNHKKQSFTSQKPTTIKQLDIFAIAEHELIKFNEVMRENESDFESKFLSIDKLLGEMHKYSYEGVSEQDVDTIKSQLFRKQNDKLKEGHCQNCLELRQKIVELESALTKTAENLTICEDQLASVSLRKEVESVKDQLLSNVEINLLNLEITQLNGDINILRNQKNNLEKTFLFNKTKNSQLQFRMQLQKSKGLSAAKNSTNSSELMNRNQTIVFIDPMESDVEEWIKFFESQKNRYMSMCKKQESERIKQLGRSFTKQQKIQLHGQGKLFVIFSSIKQIWKNLVKIRQNTQSFLASQSSKSFLKDKFNSQNEGEATIKDQNQRLNMRLTKLMKLNEYLLRQKQNLEEINEGLKSERVKQNSVKYRLQEELSQSLCKLGNLLVILKQYEEEKKLLEKSLQMNQSELQARMVELKRYKKLVEGKSASKGHRSSSHKVQFS